MRLTNIYNLPAELVLAIQNDTYEPSGDIGVTGLIGPPRIAQLRKRHANEIVDDASNYIWALLGSSVHAMLERASNRHLETLVEQRLRVKVAGWTVTGIADHYDGKTYTLNDYKTTNSYAVREPKDEWKMQLNVYAYMFRSIGFRVDNINVIAFIKDWMYSKAIHSKDFPQQEVAVIPIQLFPQDAILDYIEERVKLHQAAVDLSDDDLPICTPDERWETPTVYAVMNGENKRALKLCQSTEEAQARIDAGIGTHIVERKGECVRCERTRPGTDIPMYCNVRKWCKFYQSLKD